LAGTVLDDLLRAEQLIRENKHEEASIFLQEISKKKKLSEEDKLASLILTYRVKLILGEKEGAYNQAKKIWPKIKKLGNILPILDYLIIIIDYSRTKSDFDGGIEVVEKHKELVLKLEEKIPKKIEKRYKYRKNVYCRLVGILYWYKGKFDESLDYSKQCLEIGEELQEDYMLIDASNNIGLANWSKGNIDEAIKYYEQALRISEKAGYKLRAARVLTNLGNAYTQKGDLETALKKQQQSLKLKKELGNRREIAITLINIGVVFHLKGEINQALNYYKEALKVGEEIDSKLDIALALNNIGNIYLLKGELNKGIDDYKKSLQLYKELDIKEKIALLQLNIGSAFNEKGEEKEANSYYLESLENYEKIENHLGSAMVLFVLIQEATEKKDLKEANKHLDKLQQINKSVKIETIDLRYRLAKAFVYKNDKQTRIRTKAIVLLEQIIEEEVIDHSLTVIAMINLCDMLIVELKQSGDSELLTEIKVLIQKLRKIAEEQKSNPILVEIYRLEALLSLAELDLKETRKLLQIGLALAEEKGLENIASSLRKEQQNLEEQITLWEKLQKQNAPLIETLQHVKIEESMKHLQKEETIAYRKLFSLKL
jgi:tetratricopeptide (TPR) repeat protein